MFGRLNRAMIAELQERLEAAIAANQKLSQHAFLLDIQRSGRSNKFLFVRNGEVHEIETMGLLSDDIAKWKEDLLP